MLFVELILVFFISYLIGSVNMSIIISKLLGKGDIREQGSKNAGTTNTLRILGKGPALLVFIWDVLKGALAIGLARGVSYICGFDFETFNYAYTCGIMLATVGVVLGHNFPVYFGFKGGKGVATSLGCILAIEPQIGLVCLAAGVSMIALFNMVSIGSIIAAIIYPICILFMGGTFDPVFATNARIRVLYIIFSFLMALSVILRHKENIKRIRNGTESTLIKSKKEKIEEEVKENEIKEEAHDLAQEVKEETKEETKETIEEEIDIKFEPKKEEIKEEVKEEKTKKKTK